MRQYRGLTKEGKWVYGWYVEAKTCSIIVPQNTHVGELLSNSIEVIPETVRQFTGLKERYGEHKDVWQGDIVKWNPVDYDWDDYSDDLNEEEIGVIVWFQSAGRWAIEVRSRTYWSKEIDFFDVEIIGNIHQPELMEQGNGK